MLKGKTIILGVTGSIAAIKAPILARELMRRGATVHCAMTPAAIAFTTPLALSALTQQAVITDILPKEKTSGADAGTWHIHLARSADLMLIAPCSATTIGKLRSGIYDNAVTLLASALPRAVPLFLAPAMDEEMWLQPIVQENIHALRTLGTQIIDPTNGALASGLTGMGRMLEPAELVNTLELAFDNASNTVQASNQLQSNPLQGNPLRGKRVLITGGPTQEPIDPVRYIGNRSSGKMAAALATSARELGATVTLIMGPSVVKTEANIRRINIETSEEMRSAVERELATSDIVIMNAAVSDFAVASPSDKKIKKQEITSSEGKLSLELRQTTDILATLAAHKRDGQFIVGFALETGDNAEAYAKSKLAQKGLDMIVLNRADEPGAGFATDTNKVIIFSRNGDREALPLLSKEECAARILDRIALQVA
ncbi:MAG: bifunctional phosphopantothenoylcysteine decarboxylase/phosphopantothenate--cysteine ligase CoaBC [Candidatus Kapaibacterium sp.]